MSEVAAPPSADPNDETPPPISREQRRSRRKRAVRARTINVKRMTKREFRLGQTLYPEQPGVDYKRPLTRSDCENGPRPCPYVSCTHHLYLDVSDRTGAIKLNFPDLEPDDLEHSCALDLAEHGGVTLEETAAFMNITRERVRQLELQALAPLRPLLAALGGVEAFSDAFVAGTRRRLPVLDGPRGVPSWYPRTMAAVHELAEAGAFRATALAALLEVSIHAAHWRLDQLAVAGNLVKVGPGRYQLVDQVDTEAPPAAAE